MTGLNSALEVMARPMASDRRNLFNCYDDDTPMFFKPWDIFPAVYGTYSAEFDNMAIEVLTSVLEGRAYEEPLSHHMFREMLCVVGLCDYATSPRGCFPNYTEGGIEAILSELLEKWKQYRIVLWGGYNGEV
jgi:hypothetical protein